MAFLHRPFDEGQVVFVVVRRHHEEGGRHFFFLQHIQHRLGGGAGAVVKGEEHPLLPVFFRQRLRGNKGGGLQIRLTAHRRGPLHRPQHGARRAGTADAPDQHPKLALAFQ